MASGVSAATRPVRRPSPAVLVALAVAVAASGVLLLVLMWPDMFALDDWDYLLHRRGFSADVVLDPHNNHIALLPILIYKGVLATFGMDSVHPLQVIHAILFLTSVVIVFAWLRRRVPDWVAFAAVLPILFFGGSWIDLLFHFQLAFAGSMCTGVGALLALEAGTRGRDRLACGLLVVSIAFSSLGLPFIVAALVFVAWRGEPRSRLYVAAVPFGLYALWFAGWGHKAESLFDLANVPTVPSYVFDGLSASASSLLGLATSRNDNGIAGALDWGRPLTAGLLALAAYVIYRRGSVTRGLAVALSLLGAFWISGALIASPFREAISQRYQYMGAIFLLMVAAELARGVRFRPPAVAVVLAVSVAATASNLVALIDGGHSFDNGAPVIRGDLAGLEISRASVDPGFLLTQENSGIFYANLVDARSYLSAVDAFGSPAYSPEELPGAPEGGRVAADRVAAQGEHAALVPAARTPRGAGPAPVVLVPEGAGAAAGPCVTVRDPAGAPVVVALPAGGAVVRTADGAEVEASLRRFATASFPVSLGKLGGEPQAVRIAPDDVGLPWQLQLTGATRAVTVCGGVGE